MPHFVPTRADVYRTRAYLHYRLGLPNELVFAILDEARYWVERKIELDTQQQLLDIEWSNEYSAAFPYLGMRAFPFGDSTRESPKIKEIEFLIVSHDQGWTTEATAGTYETSSWFEGSILRPGPRFGARGDSHINAQFNGYREVRNNVYFAKEATFFPYDIDLVSRPILIAEPQRSHCEEMMKVTSTETENLPNIPSVLNKKEGDHAWWLQGNEVARGPSVFEGEMVRRYRVVWGRSRWVGNSGTGSGEGFIDSLQQGDWICIWARAKRRGWENHVHGVRMTIRYTII